MSEYDAESFCKAILKLFQDNLNDEIDVVNALYSDFQIGRIDNGAYFVAPLSDDVVSSAARFDQFIAFGIDDENTEMVDSFPSRTSETISLFFIVNLVNNVIGYDGAFDKEALYRLLRYKRAMKAVVNKNYNTLKGFGKITVKNISNDIYSLDNVWVRNGGISCGVTIGGV